MISFVLCCFLNGSKEQCMLCKLTLPPTVVWLLFVLVDGGTAPTSFQLLETSIKWDWWVGRFDGSTAGHPLFPKNAGHFSIENGWNVAQSLQWLVGVARKWVNQRRLFVGWQCQSTTSSSSSSSARLTHIDLLSLKEAVSHILFCCEAPIYLSASQHGSAVLRGALRSNQKQFPSS